LLDHLLVTLHGCALRDSYTAVWVSTDAVTQSTKIG
jgi:hypothetical protein